ncbi:hypothetical protein [Microtetraspora malaysiensis]|uniref:hypothetical protein n=1 Tax=Microtetraspora malaysiensis TaxID=161358 RepID=UPI003D8B380C
MRQQDDLTLDDIIGDDKVVTGVVIREYGFVEVVPGRIATDEDLDIIAFESPRYQGGISVYMVEKDDLLSIIWGPATGNNGEPQ